MEKSDYISAVKNFKKEIDSFGKSKSDTPTKLKVWVDYYNRACKIGVDNKFIDNKIRLQLNKLNRSHGGLGSLNGENSDLTMIKTGLDMILKNTIDESLSPRVKNEIVKRLREYGTVDDRHHAEEPNYENFPSAWLQGRGSTKHQAKIAAKDADYDDTNFNKQNSGQDDLEEANATAGSKIHKFITGKNLTLKGKKYSEIEFEVLGTDNNSKHVKLRVLSPKNLFGEEITVPFRVIKRGPFLKTNTGNAFESIDELDSNPEKEDKNGFVDNTTSQTAWLQGREGRKFKKDTYDKDGDYDDTNFNKKDSGQPDINEVFPDVNNIKFFNKEDNLGLTPQDIKNIYSFSSAFGKRFKQLIVKKQLVKALTSIYFADAVRNNEHDIRTTAEKLMSDKIIDLIKNGSLG